MSGAFNVGESRGITSVALPGHPVFHAPMRPVTGYTVCLADRDGQPMVTIHPDGRMEFAGSYSPEPAARAFWDMVRRFAPTPAAQEFGAPLKARIDKALARGERAESLLRDALRVYEDVVEGRIDGWVIGTTAGNIRGFLNTPEEP
ncbi:hypothetical protein ACIBAC_00075 [Streptomyces sp. NPDC051362]|uniref:hypothetical protein n=1 Tax=Streptomyces sp. NPDC051362 TaxID=3365651 RepID=UPI0037978466